MEATSGIRKKTLQKPINFKLIITLVCYDFLSGHI